MKRILLLAGILIAVSSVLQAQPKIKFEKETQELGYVLWRNPVTVTYHFTNDGDKLLVITDRSEELESTYKDLGIRDVMKLG